MEAGIIYALLAAFGIGIANVILKIAFKSFSPALSFVFFTFFIVIIWSISGLFVGVEVAELPEAFLYGLLSAFFAQAVYYYALSKGELSITAPLMASYPIYTILFSYFFLNERLTNTHAILVGLTILGTIIVAIPKKISKNDILNLTYIKWPLISAMSIGFSDALSKGFIDDLSLGTYVVGLAWAHVPVAILFFMLSKEKISNITQILKDFRSYKYVLIGTFMLSFATMFIFFAFGYAEASIAAPISSSYPVLTVILSLLFLGEKLSIKDIVGLIVVIGAVVGIGVV